MYEQERTYSFVHGRSTKILGIISLASLISGPLTATAQPNAPTSTEPAQTATTEHPTGVEWENWRKAMLATRPAGGCFTATYPDRQWRQVPCKTPSGKLYLPRRGPTSQIEIVGGKGPDVVAVVTGHITEAEGSFDSVTNVSSVCSVPCPNQTCPTNPTCTSGSTANGYSLQINTERFTTSTCSGSPDPTQCKGWQQFVYDSQGGGVIQYWLITYGPAGTMCPMPRGASCQPNKVSTDGWCPFQFKPTEPVYCVVNAEAAAPAPAELITSLSQIRVTGGAAGSNPASATDSIAVSVGNHFYTQSGNNYFPDLGSQWQEAEFNVFGDSDGNQAVFNSGATLVVRIAVSSGTDKGPGCRLTSYTGESTNLTLGNSLPTASPGSAPALVFSATNPAPTGALATCADALSLGDTHLRTFGGLLYDFQGTGDFLLAETGPEFVVQNSANFGGAGVAERIRE